MSHNLYDMKNWDPMLCSALGALAYAANSELLPTWSHTLVGAFTGFIFIAVYWLISNKLKIWVRVSISVVVAVAAAAIVRIIAVA